MGAMVPPSRKSCYNFRVVSIDRVVDGDDELSIRTELKGGVGLYGRLLGWLYVGDEEISLNELMITEGYAWAVSYTHLTLPTIYSV